MSRTNSMPRSSQNTRHFNYVTEIGKRESDLPEKGTVPVKRPSDSMDLEESNKRAKDDTDTDKSSIANLPKVYAYPHTIHIDPPPSPTAASIDQRDPTQIPNTSTAKVPPNNTRQEPVIRIPKPFSISIPITQPILTIPPYLALTQLSHFQPTWANFRDRDRTNLFAIDYLKGHSNVTREDFSIVWDTLEPETVTWYKQIEQDTKKDKKGKKGKK
ncbi:hypothetical protein BGW80DRAFT_1250156 [Lactifluus volemus]|nr:hypothetical protein BGW80DRAFT_1250156 [Lactifluus volemus]